MDLKSFSEQKGKNDPYHGWRDESVLHEKQEQKKESSAGGMDEAAVRSAISKFAGMNNDQLMALLSMHMKSKIAKGESAEVMEMIEKIKPFLDEKQKKRMEEIIKGLGL